MVEYILVLLAVILVVGGVEIYRNGDTATINWKTVLLKYGVVFLAGLAIAFWSDQKVFQHIQYAGCVVALAILAQRIKRK
jgi:hypothetical protein